MQCNCCYDKRWTLLFLFKQSFLLFVCLYQLLCLFQLIVMYCTQLLKTVVILKQNNALSCLELTHSHTSLDI